MRILLMGLLLALSFSTLAQTENVTRTFLIVMPTERIDNAPLPLDELATVRINCKLSETTDTVFYREKAIDTTTLEQVIISSAAFEPGKDYFCFSRVTDTLNQLSDKTADVNVSIPIVVPPTPEKPKPPQVTIIIGIN